MSGGTTALPVVPRMKALPIGAKTFWRIRHAQRTLAEAIAAYPSDYQSVPPVPLAECRGEVELFFTSEYSVCNYRCPYCYIGWAPDDRKAWDTRDIFPKIVHRLAGLKHRIKLNCENMGEWFTNQELIGGTTFLTRRENLIWVSITTNASLLPRMFAYLDEVDVNKVSFTCTYHATEVSLDDYMEQVRALKARGANVVTATVCFPGNVEHCQELKRRSEELGVHFRMNLEDRMWREAGDVPAETVARLYDLLEDHRKWDAQRHGRLLGLNHTRGDLCTAGRNYLWINSTGDMFICSSASAMATVMKDNDEVSFGNIFELESDYLPTRDEDIVCPFDGCSCPKDTLRRSAHQDMFHISERSRHEVYFKTDADRETLPAKGPVTRLK